MELHHKIRPLDWTDNEEVTVSGVFFRVYVVCWVSPFSRLSVHGFVVEATLARQCFIASTDDGRRNKTSFFETRGTLVVEEVNGPVSSTGGTRSYLSSPESGHWDSVAGKERDLIRPACLPYLLPTPVSKCMNSSHKKDIWAGAAGSEGVV